MLSRKNDKYKTVEAGICSVCSTNSRNVDVAARGESQKKSEGKLESKVLVEGLGTGGLGFLIVHSGCCIENSLK